MAIDKIQSESINLGDNFAFTGTVSGAGGNNQPYFTAYSTSNISLSQNTATIIVLSNTLVNQGSAYNTSDGKFKPQVAGNYFVFFNFYLKTLNKSVLQEAYILKNGSSTSIQSANEAAASTAKRQPTNLSGIVTMNGSSDYLQASITQYDYTSGEAKSIDDTQFGSFKII